MEYSFAWLALGLLLGAVEMMLGSYFLLAFVGGALFTGGLAMIIPMHWMYQIGVFAVASVCSVFLLLRWRKNKDDTPHPNDDIQRLQGQRVDVVVRIAPDGRVRYKGVEWKAHADHIIEAGESAIVERVQGSTLHVKIAVGG